MAPSGKGSEPKHQANRLNSRLSTGPQDTSQTRLNALVHGIYSRECVISHGTGREDPKDFDDFRLSMLHAFSPVGALEELLADDLIQLAWRRRRIVRYETAVIAQNLDMVGLVGFGGETTSDLYLATARLQSTGELVDRVQRDRAALEALTSISPLDEYQQIWTTVVKAAFVEFDVKAQTVLQLNEEDDARHRYTKEELERVIDACIPDAGNRKPFWEAARKSAAEDLLTAESELDRRKSQEREQRMASVPDDYHMAKIQRYESHLSRLFDRALHELERLQARRVGYAGPVPAALDINISAPEQE